HRVLLSFPTRRSSDLLVHPTLDTVWVVKVGSNYDVRTFTLHPGANGVCLLLRVLRVVENPGSHRVERQNVYCHNRLTGDRDTRNFVVFDENIPSLKLASRLVGVKTSGYLVFGLFSYDRPHHDVVVAVLSGVTEDHR